MQKWILAFGIAGLLLAACGNTRGERVLTGAGGGAVAGQVIADKPVEGALVGGAIGAVR
jgi:osmotically inducible lipoprotein OsmB